MAARRAVPVPLAGVLLVAALLVGVVVLIGTNDERPAGPIPRLEQPGPAWRPDERALGAAVAAGAARSDARYRRAFLATFTSLTPENAMKWSIVEPERGAWSFGDADALVEWARAGRKRVRGHTLVWDHQLPDWVTREDWAPAELERVLSEHVTTLMRRYRGRVESWDVVNEPLEDDGSWTPNVFYRVLGPRYVDVAFGAARAADPDARLFLNEIAAERDTPKRRALLELAAGMRARGVPIDGVGFQNHTEAGRAPTRTQLIDALGRVQALGLDVEITEMDVAVGPGRPASRQPAAYAAAASACSVVRRCTGLTVWGVDDRRSWIGAERAPLLLDVDGLPKPALSALLTAWHPALD